MPTSLITLASFAITWPGTLCAQGYTGIVLYRLQPLAGFSSVFGNGVGPGDDASDPAGIGYEFASAGRVVGEDAMQGSATSHPFLWSTPLGTPVDLNPPGFTSSKCLGTDGMHQVGFGGSGTSHALLWSGTAASVLDLHPASGFMFSYATGVGGNQQVGFGQVTSSVIRHAFLWTGTAASLVDLQPTSGFTESFAAATNGTQQVGYGISSVLDGGIHALRWSGTAASRVDLHPASGYIFTFALGLGGGQQVGYANMSPQFPPSPAHAVVWPGTAASMVDLNPNGFNSSYAVACGGGKQVGWGVNTATGFNHALVWSGTANSAVDLHSLLPAPIGQSFNSYAISIDANGNIFGMAADTLTFPPDVYAVEWSPTPAKLANISTRLKVLTGANVLIGGFIVSGSGNENGLLRALGPTLTQFGITDALANPTMELHTGGGTLIASDDNWKDKQQSQIAATGKGPPNDLESAIWHSYGPGNYTAIVSGVNQTTGTALVEAYDLDAGTTIQFSNISTRGFVNTGNAVMIGGFIIDGPTGSFLRVVVRGLGPTLTQFGVPGALQDPTLALRDKDGNLIVSNDNWKDTQMTDIQATNRAPPNDHESAIRNRASAG